MNKKIGVKGLALIFSIMVSTAACASGGQADAMKLLPSGEKQTTVTGSGLQSLLTELSSMGIDPNKLSYLDSNGQVITPFTPGSTVQWQRISTVSGSTGIHANDVANGKGNPGDIEIDTVKNGTTITVFTWQYQKLSNGSYGWVAIGVVSYTIQAGTQQK